MKYDEDKEEEKKPTRLWSLGEEKEVNRREMVEERREGPNVVEEKGGGIKGGGLTVLF